MTSIFLDFDDVSFGYADADGLLVQGVSFRLGPGWTGVIGANGAGKTTLLRLACGELRPTKGTVRTHERVAYCPQRTDAPPGFLAGLLDSRDAEAYRLRAKLGLEPEWLERWEALSHGERRRAQIAAALWRAPTVLAVDEPTNHIDTDARRMLAEALRCFHGIGLLVSHDRDLVDSLCRQCIVVDPQRLTVRPGGYSAVQAQILADRESARRAHAVTKAELRRLRAVAAERGREAARADRLRSKRWLPMRSSDAKTKIDIARLTGKDGQAGRLLNQLQGRLRQAEQRLRSIRVHREHPMGARMSGVPSGRKVLLRLPAGALALGPVRWLGHPELAIGRQDRIGLVGPNGAGKSTLVRRVVGAFDLPSERLVYLPQEISADRGATLLEETRALKRDELGEVMSYVSRLGSPPERLLQTARPSPGETRKLMLALGMLREPHLVVMDEPTNHLDLPSIECLEEALSECACALLIVSHDSRLLRRLTRMQWQIAPASADRRIMQLRTASRITAATDGYT